MRITARYGRRQGLADITFDTVHIEHLFVPESRWKRQMRCLSRGLRSGGSSGLASLSFPAVGHYRLAVCRVKDALRGAAARPGLARSLTRLPARTRWQRRGKGSRGGVGCWGRRLVAGLGAAYPDTRTPAALGGCAVELGGGWRRRRSGAIWSEHSPGQGGRRATTWLASYASRWLMRANPATRAAAA